jgi:TonB family protein
MSVTFVFSSAVVTAADMQQPLAFMAHDQQWERDLIKTAPPLYPYADRARRHQGKGIFRLALDQKTGSVVQVTVEKSTGYKTLDDSAIGALRQWRFRPSKRKIVHVPVNFVMSSSHKGYINETRRLQQQQRSL